ncbi:peptidoglycan-binding protein [Woodsholea maritima]|uniref:peptidoglycan-binding protein n=1 Tax=Woodsholea maritima TaxID=240237 RepID=UPI00037A5DD6|nr:peptidoglycan-binding protein [Woodsholea maritima]
MASGTPWSIKGIDPRARAIAKSAARKEGMTLGEWLNSVILEDGEPAAERSKPWDKLAGFPGFARPGGGGGDDDGPGDEDSELNNIVQRLSERLEAAEQRSALALTGVDHSVLNLARRLERIEEERDQHDSDLDETLVRTRAAQEELLDRIRKLERQDPAQITPESVKAIEKAVGKIAQRLFETENTVRSELQHAESRDDKAQSDLEKTTKALSTRLEDIEKRAKGEYNELKDLLESRERRATEGLQGLYDATRAMQLRLSQAEEHTDHAAKALSTHQEMFEQRLREIESRSAGSVSTQSFQRRFEHLSDELAQVIARTRSELANEISRASQAPRVDQIEAALKAAESRIEAAEARHSQALAKIGTEIGRMARAMDRRLKETERRVQVQAQAPAPRPVQPSAHIEARLDEVRRESTDAVKRIGEEVSKLGNNLAERVSEAEARSAAAVEAAGERMAQMLERLESQRVASPEADLEARISASEERTARRIEEAMQGVHQRLDIARAETHEALSPVQRAMTALAERLEAIEQRHPGAHAARTQHAPAQEDAGEWIEAQPQQPYTPQAPKAEPTGGANRDFDEPLPLPPGYNLGAQPHSDPALEDDGFILNALDMPSQQPQGARQPQAQAQTAQPHMAQTQAAQTQAAPAQPQNAPQPQAQPAKPAPLGATANAEFLAAARKSTRTGQNSYNQAMGAAPMASAPVQGLSLPKAQGGRLLLIGLLVVGFLTIGSAFALLMLDRTGSEPRQAQANTDAVSQLFAATPSSAQEPPVAEPQQPPQTEGEGEARPFDPDQGSARPDSLSSAADETPLEAPREAQSAPAPRLETPAQNVEPQPIGAAQEPGAQDLGAPSPAVERAAPPLTLEAAAAQGHPIARYQLGLRLYREGEFADAAALLRRAAEQGVPDAQYRYAKMLERGEGMEQDFLGAARWNQEAAEAGHGRAMHNMGVLLVTGQMGEPDYERAKRWFELAALHGVADSQNNLALFFERGIGGTAQSLPDAYAWYSILAQSGDEAAPERVAALRPQISPEAAAQADQVARQFTPRPLDPIVQGQYGPQAWDQGENSVSVQRAQTLLARLGYDVGPTDGDVGPKTREAIIAYQSEHNLDQTGTIDAALIARLERTDGR